MTTTYLLEHAWVGGRVEPGVVVDVEDGVITAVTLRDRSSSPDGEPRPLQPDHVLLGLTIPGLANCHSHAFHRALRGRTQRGRGTFWTWRDQMYVVAGRLDPDSYFELARATYREMVAAGHHRGRGVPLPPPPAGRDAVRRPQRHGARPPRGGPRGRHPDHPARHALPLQRLRQAAAGRAGPLQRRQRAGLGGPGGRDRRRPRRPRRGGAALGAGRAAGRARARRAHPPGRAARAPVGAGRRERGLPGGVRRHPDPAARRPRAAPADHHAGARHPPDRRPTSRSSARPTPTSTSARPPSATSATGSARAAASPTPAPG